MSSGPIPAGYNTPAPSKILTPDRVESRLGALEFSDGVPTAETADRLFDNLDHMRAVFERTVLLLLLEAQHLRAGSERAGKQHQGDDYDDLPHCFPCHLR